MNVAYSSVFLVDDVMLSEGRRKSFFLSFTKCRIADQYMMLYEVIVYQIADFI